jgi:hypothetical protein
MPGRRFRMAGSTVGFPEGSVVVVTPDGGINSLDIFNGQRHINCSFMHDEQYINYPMDKNIPTKSRPWVGHLCRLDIQTTKWARRSSHSPKEQESSVVDSNNTCAEPELIIGRVDCTNTCVVEGLECPKAIGV